MILAALYFAFACFGLGLVLTGYRIVYAPGVSDRVLALDTLVINFIAIIILYGILQGSAMYFETTLLFAMVGFVSTVAYAKFILRGDVIE
ncbi:K+/H+ antiporter subunit F [Paracoccus sp. p4-l81]|uniref:K+/H+ antiporter subunit F n=1 Tax=unclassified Paracoccus (in: a-proteobacteria) TaxID=2688777 RepID=UPI0035B8EAB4